MKELTNDKELQFADLNINTAEKKAVAKEATRSEMSGDRVWRIKSSYVTKYLYR